MWNEVYVLGFEVDFAAEVSNENSLPLGSHFSSFDFTESIKNTVINYNIATTMGIKQVIITKLKASGNS